MSLSPGSTQNPVLRHRLNEGLLTEEEVEATLTSFPPGYRFKPLDEELVVFYLRKKLFNEPLPLNRIKEVQLYKYNPQKLADENKSYGEGEWYFFTPRDKKYPNGSRPRRSTGDGYWKATGADRTLTYKGAEVGYRKALVFYHGKAPSGDKTEWMMHEFRLKDPPAISNPHHDEMRLDEWVLCKIYKKTEHKSSFKTSDPRQQANADDGTHTQNQNPDKKRRSESFQAQAQTGSILGEEANALPQQEGISKPFGFGSHPSLMKYKYGDQHATWNDNNGVLAAFTAPKFSYYEGMLDPNSPLFLENNFVADPAAYYDQYLRSEPSSLFMDDLDRFININPEEKPSNVSHNF